MNTINTESFRFMADLWENNNKQWFDANRKRYDKLVRQPIKAIAGSLSDPVAMILPEFDGKAKISRINNDIRFHHNKPPYKEHVWISFSVKNNPTDLFAAIGRNGWCAGCGISASKRDPLDGWRYNVLNNAERWRSYCKALGLGEILQLFIEKKYKKPLYPDIPDDLIELIQAKSVWIVQKPRLSFEGAPEKEFFRDICQILPIYLFMSIPPEQLINRLDELGDRISPPDSETASLWKLLK